MVLFPTPTPVLDEWYLWPSTWSEAGSTYLRFIFRFVYQDTIRITFLVRKTDHELLLVKLVPFINNQQLKLRSMSIKGLPGSCIFFHSFSSYHLSSGNLWSSSFICHFPNIHHTLLSLKGLANDLSPIHTSPHAQWSPCLCWGVLFKFQASVFEHSFVGIFPWYTDCHACPLGIVRSLPSLLTQGCVHIL